MDEKRAKSRLRLLFAVAVFIHLNSYGAAVQAGDTLSLGAFLSGNQTLISKNGTFEFGFFSPNGTNNWYIGIWFANIPQQTIVWVANRETPARSKPGILKLSREGKLDLFDAEGASIWSVNVSSKASRAVILDSGNFLMLNDDNKSETVWQSLDNPTDTWLPATRFGKRQKLVSWKSSSDPSPGPFSYQLDPSGAYQIVLIWNNSVSYWGTGIWDGTMFSRLPEMASKDVINVSVEITSSGMYAHLAPAEKWTGISTRFMMLASGHAQYSLFDGKEWNVFWTLPKDQCAVYGLCGTYENCNDNNLDLFYNCMEGFTPIDNRAYNSREWWSSGCVRQSPLNCTADRFIDSNLMSFNDYASSYPGVATTKMACEKACLNNCSCTAYDFNPPSRSCQIWSGTLLNLYNSPSKSNSNVFIRVATSAIPNFNPPSPFKLKTVLPVVLGIYIALAISLGIFAFLMQRRWHRLRSMERSKDSSNPFLRMFSYKELKTATRNFRSKLGSGGFGTVFKRSLPDDTLVAVKKLESSSSRNDKQFRAEISSLGNMQHGNLIRLRGFCAQGFRQLLVYDYMPNDSLNSLFFSGDSKTKWRILD